MADDNAVPGAEQARLGQIGPYQLLKLIGEGAAGQVFLAEQQQPHRQVALKVLRSAAGAGRARFEREVSLLASLEHTNIARLYDSGTAEGPAGEVPYLVMEHVDGLDLIQYARQQQLNTEQRLQLLAQVARAAHFAHTRGVIHRDLKPGNILVNQRGEPKILDFGVAHVVADDATQMTGAGEVLGTLSYMSWEQLCGEAQRIDARSDVYALGVIGYQLIADELPFPGLRQDTLVSALGRLQREQPTPLAQHQPTARGDIDTLIMKAMAREPERRYGSAAEFAADIERYLRHQPIEARPPTLSYVLGLFVRRHKALTFSVVTVALALLIATVIATRYAIVADRALLEAHERAAEYAAINQFTAQMLSAVQPEAARGRAVTVMEVVEQADNQLREDPNQPPRVRSSLEVMLGQTYQALGESEKALPLIQSAAKSRLQVLGPTHAETLDAQTLWVQLLDVLGRRDEVDRRLSEFLGSDDPSNIAINADNVGLLMMRAISWTDAERPELAIPLLDRLLDFSKANPEKLDTGTDLSAEYWRGHALDLSGDLPAALESAIRVFNRSVKVWGEQSPHTETYRQNLASRYAWMGRFQEAEPLFRQAITSASHSQGMQHPYVASMRSNFARMLLDAGRPTEAAEEAGFSMQVHAQHGGAQTSEYARAQAHYGAALAHQGKTSAAEEQLRSVQALASTLGADNRWVLRSRIWSAENLLLSERPQQAVEQLKPLVSDLHTQYGALSGLAGEAGLILARSLIAQGRLAEAGEALAIAKPALARFAGPEHPLNETATKLQASLSSQQTDESSHEH